MNLQKKFAREQRELFLEFSCEEPIHCVRDLQGNIGPNQLQPLFLTLKQFQRETVRVWELNERIENWSCLRVAGQNLSTMEVSIEKLTQLAELYFQRQLKLPRTCSEQKKRIEGRFTLQSVQAACTMDSLLQFQHVQNASASLLPAMAITTTECEEVVTFGGFLGNLVQPNLTLASRTLEDSLGQTRAMVCLVQCDAVRWIKFPCLTCGLDFDCEKDRAVHCQWFCRNSFQPQQPPPYPPPLTNQYSFADFDCLVLPNASGWLVKQGEGRMLQVAMMQFTWTNEANFGIRAFEWEKSITIINQARFHPVCLQQDPRTKQTINTIWGLTIPKQLYDNGRRRRPVNRHLIIDRTTIGNETKLLNQLGPLLNMYGFNDITVFGHGSGGVAYNANLSANFFTTNEAVQFLLGNNDSSAEPSTLTTACAVCVDKTLEASQRDVQMRTWKAHERNEAEFHTPQSVPINSKQPLGAFFRSIIQSCAKQAMEVKHRRQAAGMVQFADSAIEVFTIVLGTHDGDNAIASKELDRMDKYLNGSSTRAMCKIIAPTKNCPANLILEAVACWDVLHRVQFGIGNFIHLALEEKDGANDTAAALFAQVNEDLNSMVDMLTANMCTVTVPHWTPWSDGFLVSADLPPARTVTFCFDDESDDEHTVFFETQLETPPPSHCCIQWNYNCAIPIVAKRLPVGQCLRAAQNLCLSARLAAGRGRAVHKFLQFGRLLADQPLLPVVRAAAAVKDINEVLRIVRQRKFVSGVQTLLRETLNQVSTANLNQASSVQARADWICKPLDFKFGATMLKRMSRAIHGGDDEAKMLLLAKQQCSLDGFDTTQQQSLLELLYTVPMYCDAVRIKLVRTDASAIDPFLIKVLVVSGDLVPAPQTMEIMQEIELGIIRKDTVWGTRVPDALLLEPLKRLRSHLLFKAFNASVFTRNPTLQLPDQYLAMVFASYVRACEQLLKWRDLKASAITSALPEYTMENVLPFVQTVRRIFDVMQSFAVSSQLSARVMHVLRGWELTSPSEFAAWIGPKTEQDGVASVAEMVCVACLFPEHSTAYKQVAMVCEAVARQAKSVVRRRRIVARKMLRQALGIITSSPPQDDDDSKVDFASGFDFTSRFFAQPCNTNCSVWGVVASLGLGALLSDPANDNEAVFYAMQANKVSMQAFFDTNLESREGKRPRLFQIGLFCQAFDTVTREERASKVHGYVHAMLAGTRTKEMLQAMARNERQLMHMDYLLEQQRLMREGKLIANRKMRHNIALAEQTLFIAQHLHAPRTFLPAEVARLNLTRSKDDQLELDAQSGLLRHHCCFEQCPDFLRSFKTAKDKVLNTRTGLFRHLNRCQFPSKDYYLRELHVRCKSWILTFKQDQMRMTQHEFMLEYMRFIDSHKHIVGNVREEWIRFGKQVYQGWEKLMAG